MTGHSRAEDRRAATDAGFDDYLIKPLTLAAVKAAIARGVEATLPGAPVLAEASAPSGKS